MNEKVREHLQQARIIILDEIKKLQSELDSLDALLHNVNKIPLRIHMARNQERRKGAVKQVKEALAVMGSGSIREVSAKVQELYPIIDEVNLLSKVSTYLKRLHNDGDITCEKKNKVKVYSSLIEIPN